MDNVTHSLIGVVLGEGISRKQRASDPALRTGILWAAVLGSNLPDFDFLLRFIVRGGSLGSLLHHRGFTHTVFFSLALALIAAGVGRLAARKPVSWTALLMAGWIGVLLHIGADFWNEYGVHPFWPFTNQWFYGDFIFIVEPLLLMALVPFALSAARSRWAKILISLVGAILLGLAWFSGYLPWLVAGWVTFWCGMWFMIQRKVHRGVGPAFASILIVLVMFAVGSQVARTRAQAALPSDEQLLQLVSTPSPGNPFCWRIWLTSRKGDLYHARLGVVGLAPFGSLGRANDPTRCYTRLTGGAVDPLLAEVGELPRVPSVKWLGEFKGNVSEIMALKESRCRVRALMRFVRVPFWKPETSGERMVGDLRYHPAGGYGFADIISREGEPCLKFEPPWSMPSKLFD
jgi:inner membrane protein